MIYPGDFTQFAMQGLYRPEDKRVMARVALNALVDPQRYPVDLSEVSKLRCDARALTRAFLAYMATNPIEYGTWSAMRCEIFFQALKENQADVAHSDEESGES